MPVRFQDGRQDGQRAPYLCTGRYKPVHHMDTERDAYVDYHITGRQRELMDPHSLTLAKSKRAHSDVRFAVNGPMTSETMDSYHRDGSPIKRTLRCRTPGKATEPLRPDPPSHYTTSMCHDHFIAKPVPNYVRHVERTARLPYRGDGQLMPRTFSSSTTTKESYDPTNLLRKSERVPPRHQPHVADVRPYQTEKAPLVDNKMISLSRSQFQSYGVTYPRKPIKPRNTRSNRSFPTGIGLDGSTYDAHFYPREVNQDRPYFTTSILPLQ